MAQVGRRLGAVIGIETSHHTVANYNSTGSNIGKDTNHGAAQLSLLCAVASERGTCRARVGSALNASYFECEDTTSLLSCMQLRRQLT